MKRLIIQVCAVLCSLTIDASSLPAQSQTPPPDTDAAPPSQILSTLLEMDSAGLNRLRQTIERIEAMPQSEREQLRQRIREIHQMDGAKLKQMRQRFNGIPQETREAMQQRWLDMSPQERLEWRNKLKQMSHEERAQAFEKEGFLPPPPPRHEKQNSRKNQHGPQTVQDSDQ
ncbi:MAG: hypothetical protein ACI81V_001241 [Lentimonas sp.]|jgi:uncharacterized protein (UPF0335 family)